MEEVLEEKLKELKDEFLAPIKEGLANLRQIVDKNTEDIAQCKAAIELIKANKTVVESNFEPQNIAKEISWQLKIVNRVCITNAKEEKEVRDTLKSILGTEDGIIWISEKKKRTKGGEGTSDGLPKTFMAELTPETKQRLLDNKLDFFKANKNNRIGINEALTALQLREKRSERLGEEKGGNAKRPLKRQKNRPNMSTTDDSVFEENGEHTQTKENPKLTLTHLREGIEMLEKSLRESKNSESAGLV